jgi:hypothetical protein
LKGEIENKLVKGQKIKNMRIKFDIKNKNYAVIKE